MTKVKFPTLMAVSLTFWLAMVLTIASCSGDDGSKGDKGDQGLPGEGCALDPNATDPAGLPAVKVTCGPNVGYLYDGTAGQPGRDGLDYCYVEPSADPDPLAAYDIICGSTKYGTLYNGRDGTAGEPGQGGGGSGCTLTDSQDGLSIIITCGSAQKVLGKATCGAAPYNPQSQLCVAGELLDATSNGLCPVLRYITNTGTISDTYGATHTATIRELVVYKKPEQVCYKGKIYTPPFKWCGPEKTGLPYYEDEEFCVGNTTTYDLCANDGATKNKTSGVYDPLTEYCAVTAVDGSGATRKIVKRALWTQCRSAGGDSTAVAAAVPVETAGQGVGAPSNATNPRQAAFGEYCHPISGTARTNENCSAGTQTKETSYNPNNLVCDAAYQTWDRNAYNLCGALNITYSDAAAATDNGYFKRSGAVYDRSTDWCIGTQPTAKAGKNPCYELDENGLPRVISTDPPDTSIVSAVVPEEQFCKQDGGAGTWGICGTTKYEWDIKFCLNGTVAWRCGALGAAATTVLASDGGWWLNGPWAPTTTPRPGGGVYSNTNAFCLNTRGANPPLAATTTTTPNYANGNYVIASLCNGNTYGYNALCANKGLQGMTRWNNVASWFAEAGATTASARMYIAGNDLGAAQGLASIGDLVASLSATPPTRGGNWATLYTWEFETTYEDDGTCTTHPCVASLIGKAKEPGTLTASMVALTATGWTIPPTTAPQILATGLPVVTIPTADAGTTCETTRSMVANTATSPISMTTGFLYAGGDATWDPETWWCTYAETKMW